MKSIIKLLITAAVLHATWRAGTVYMRYWEFKEEVTQVAQFGVHQSDNQLRNNVYEAAKRREITVDPNDISVKRQNQRIIIDANYLERVELVPTYFYPWEAKVHVDVLTLVLQEAK
jgi:hypothetical protein